MKDELFKHVVHNYELIDSLLNPIINRALSGLHYGDMLTTTYSLAICTIAKTLYCSRFPFENSHPNR